MAVKNGSIWVTEESILMPNNAELSILVGEASAKYNAQKKLGQPDLMGAIFSVLDAHNIHDHGTRMSTMSKMCSALGRRRNKKTLDKKVQPFLFPHSNQPSSRTR